MGDDSDSDLNLERPAKGSKAKESKPKVEVKDGPLQSHAEGVIFHMIMIRVSVS